MVAQLALLKTSLTQVQLYLLSGLMIRDIPRFRNWRKDFTASSGIKVNVVQKSESNMDQEFITQVPTGKGPDVTVMAHDKLGP